jgi:hypothetical protein
MPSPENVRRPSGSYDPEEPFVVTYGDLLAARNAMTELLRILSDARHPPSHFQCESVRTGLRYAVVPFDEPYTFTTVEEATTWLRDLRDRFTGYLPTPPTGPQ